MLKTTKIAISLPRDDFERIEKVRKESGLPRSTIIDMAIRFWLKSVEEENMIKQYEEGYKKNPESISEIKAMEQVAADAFGEERWE